MEPFVIKEDKCKTKAQTKKLHLHISYSNGIKSKIKEKSWKKSKEKDIFPIELQNENYIDFSDITQVGREWSEIFKVLREENPPT